MGDALSVALLAPGPTLPAWAATAVVRMVERTAAEITLVVEGTDSDDRTLWEATRRAIQRREWGIVAASFELLGDDPDLLERRTISTLEGVGDPEWIRADPVPIEGWENELPDPAVDRLAETDLAVRLGDGVLVGEALSAPDMGVLSIHHGDPRKYRGQPMGFWEFVQGRETAGVTLQRTDETLDGGEVVATRQVDIADAPTWGAVRQRLFAASIGMLAEGVENLTTAAFELDHLPADELGDLHTHPRGRPVLEYVARTARGQFLE